MTAPKASGQRTEVYLRVGDTCRLHLLQEVPHRATCAGLWPLLSEEPPFQPARPVPPDSQPGAKTPRHQGQVRNRGPGPAPSRPGSFLHTVWGRPEVKPLSPLHRRKAHPLQLLWTWPRGSPFHQVDHTFSHIIPPTWGSEAWLRDRNRHGHNICRLRSCSTASPSRLGCERLPQGRDLIKVALNPQGRAESGHMHGRCWVDAWVTPGVRGAQERPGEPVGLLTAGRGGVHRLHPLAPLLPGPPPKPKGVSSSNSTPWHPDPIT